MHLSRALNYRIEENEDNVSKYYLLTRCFLITYVDDNLDADGAIIWKMELSCPLGIREFVPHGKFIMFWCFIPYNKSFIDQACSVKMAGYWPHKHAKKELGQYPAIFTLS